MKDRGRQYQQELVELERYLTDCFFEASYKGNRVKLTGYNRLPAKGLKSCTVGRYQFHYDPAHPLPTGRPVELLRIVQSLFSQPVNYAKGLDRIEDDGWGGALPGRPSKLGRKLYGRYWLVITQLPVEQS